MGREAALVILILIITVLSIGIGFFVCENLGLFEDALPKNTGPLQFKSRPSFPPGQCPITVTEGELVRIEWIGSDPDRNIGPQGFLSYEFEGKIQQNGLWQTNIGDAGIHHMKGRVFDGEFWDETEFCVQVLKLNQRALLTAAEDIVVTAGDRVQLEPVCEDPDGDKATLSFSGWMQSSTRETTHDDIGQHFVNIHCTDNTGFGETKVITVHVLDRNRPPNIMWGRAFRVNSVVNN